MEYSGGYFLLSSASANQAYYLKQFEHEGFHVEKLISMDNEVGGVFPNLFDIWASQKSERLIPVLSKQVLDNVKVSMVFEALEDALEGYREAKPQDASVTLIGFSLDEKYLSDFHEWRDPLNDETGEGVVHCLEKKQPASSGGVFAGYDIVGYELGGRFTSFLKNPLLREYLSFDPNLSINQFGLFPDQQMAEELARYTNEVLAEEGRAEEDLMWLPWKVMLYDM